MQVGLLIASYVCACSEMLRVMRKIGFIAIAASAMVIAAPAAASTYVQLNTVALFSGTGSSVSNNAININDGTVKVQVTAWTSTTPGYWNTSNGHIRSTLGQWDYGVGSQYSGSDSHTIDNTDRYDFILLQFDTKVALNTVTFTAAGMATIRTRRSPTRTSTTPRS